MFHSDRVSANAIAAAILAVSAVGLAPLAVAPAFADAIKTDDLSAQPAPSFAKLIERVRPAVVSVRVTIVNAAETGDQEDGSPAPTGPMIGLGSGFFVSGDGYIATNNHVVENAQSVTVTTDSGETLAAHVVGTDPGTDLAVIKVDKPGDYPFVSFAKDRPLVGEWVVAIGNPFGLGGTATAGIVSAKGRNISDGPYDRFLQIDAPINRGNSGGPTFNVKGEVVGINTAIYSPSGGSVGLGFAIPGSTAESVIDTLRRGDAIERGFLGVAVQPMTPPMAEALGLKTATGAIIDSVTPATPAAKADLKPGDVITKLGGETVKDSADLTLQIGQHKPGDKVELTYWRDGAEKTATVALASQKPRAVASAKPEAPKQSRAPNLGVEVAPAAEVADAGGKGVVILEVDPSGAAAASGLSRGDVILQVANKDVSTPSDIRNDISAALKQGKKAVLMRVHTAEGDRFVAVPFGES